MKIKTGRTKNLFKQKLEKGRINLYEKIDIYYEEYDSQDTITSTKNKASVSAIYQYFKTIYPLLVFIGLLRTEIITRKFSGFLIGHMPFLADEFYLCADIDNEWIQNYIDDDELLEDLPDIGDF